MGFAWVNSNTKWGLWKPRNTLRLLADGFIGLPAPPAFLKKLKSKTTAAQTPSDPPSPTFGCLQANRYKNTPRCWKTRHLIFFRPAKCYGDLKWHGCSQKCLSWPAAYLSSSLICRSERQDLPVDLAALQTSPPVIGASTSKTGENQNTIASIKGKK